MLYFSVVLFFVVLFLLYIKELNITYMRTYLLFTFYYKYIYLLIFLFLICWSQNKQDKFVLLFRHNCFRNSKKYLSVYSVLTWATQYPALGGSCCSSDAPAWARAASAPAATAAPPPAPGATQTRSGCRTASLGIPWKWLGKIITFYNQNDISVVVATSFARIPISD